MNKMLEQSSCAEALAAMVVLISLSDVLPKGSRLNRHTH